jgi:hypothetical protein
MCNASRLQLRLMLAQRRNHLFSIHVNSRVADRHTATYSIIAEYALQAQRRLLASRSCVSLSGVRFSESSESASPIPVLLSAKWRR